MARPSAFYTAFHVGDYVFAKCDPRHVGRVSAVFQAFKIRVRFENGWTADFDADELEREKRA